MKDGWKENEIKGTSKGKKKKDVKLPNLPQAKAHPPGQPGKPNPDPSSPWLPGKAPRLAYNKFDGVVYPSGLEESHQRRGLAYRAGSNPTPVTLCRTCPLPKP